MPLLQRKQKLKLENHIRKKSKAVFKTEGNLKKYENIVIRGKKNCMFSPFSKFINSIVLNEYSQLIKTNKFFELHAGYFFYCPDFFHLGEYRKKVILYSLYGEKELVNPHILRKIKKIKKMHTPISHILPSMFHGYKLIFFTFYKIEGEKYGDLTFLLNESNIFIKNLKFLQNSSLTCKILEKENPSLILNTNCTMEAIQKRAARFQKLLKPIINDALNDDESFKSEECVICFNEKPNVMFCNCGHIAICTKCEEFGNFEKCPICRTKNTIKRQMILS